MDTLSYFLVFEIEDEIYHYSFYTVSSCFRKPVPCITYLQKISLAAFFFSKRDLHASRGKRERRIRGPPPPPPPPSQNWERGTEEEEKSKITLPRTVAFAQLFKKNHIPNIFPKREAFLFVDCFFFMFFSFIVPKYCRKSYQSANKEVGEGGEKKIER